MFFVSQHCGYHKCGFNLINVSIYCHNKDKYHSLKLMLSALDALSLKVKHVFSSYNLSFAIQHSDRCCKYTAFYELLQAVKSRQQAMQEHSVYWRHSWTFNIPVQEFKTSEYHHF